jgi:signal transduction histidine kinase/CheY-like chemotaxis protein
VVDALRRQVADLVALPIRLTAQKRAAITTLETRIMIVEVAGLVFGVLAGLAGIGLFASGIARRLRLAAANARRLGDGVALLPVVPSADELGQLGESLSRAEGVLTLRLAEVSSARDDAVKATQTKNTFLSRTSHELRTPLHAVLGFAQLLEMSDLNQEDRDSAARILTAGRHLLALINELIDIGRVEAGELSLSVEPVPLHDAIEEIAMLIGPLAEARAITVEQCCTNEALAAFADRQRLRQVMVNLASNAVKYNHHGGMIRLDVRHDTGDHIELTVTDTGPGLSAEEITRVFQPFERLEAEQHGIEGTGIGLPLALALTEAMHGTLEVTSTKGYGSTFTVRLLRAPDLEALPVRAAVPGPDGAVTRRSTATDELRVLSIEDNPANSVVLARLLEGWPATTLHAASSGHAGIELACREIPDLILLDLHLPDLSGEEVLLRLRAEPATAAIPVVILSADATPGTIRRLLARGVDAYLTKPLDLRELQDVLQEIAARNPATRTGRQP